MAHESTENMTGMTDTQAPRAAQAIQDVAERAGTYVQHQATQLAERAQDLARQANEHLEDYTGRPLEDWVGDTRDLVRKHPLQAVAVMICVGYVLGKVMRR